ncbi:MAG TPA: PDZ domain-containing protein, partial [Myxococcota bacterium]|nr:PDZ domain-containing protein [Myxococcota bacterium]
LGGTVTIGVLSGRSDVPIGPGGDFMLQTDASINQGNSGGPLFNAEGEVIGVNTMILSPTGGNVGIGFAVPSSVAQSISQQLLTHGRVERGWLGIQIQRMTKPLAESLGLEESQGALITHVQEDGPADRSGLEPADVILRFADEPILRAETLPRIVAGLEAGRTAEIGIWRNRELRTVEVEIGEQKPRKIALEKDAGSREEKGPGPRDAEGSESWGIVVESIGPQVRQALGLGSDVSGVVITAVEPGGPAAGQGLRPGDLILQMAGRSVASLGDVAEQLREASEEERSRILLRVRRKDRYRFVTLPL